MLRFVKPGLMLAILLLLVALMALGCGGGGGFFTGSVGGTVTDPLSSPIAGVFVEVLVSGTSSVQNAESKTVADFTATTGADGKYMIGDIPTGSRQIRFSKSGEYETKTQSVVIDHENPATVDVQLTPLGASITGVLRDPRGVTVAGANVYWEQESNSSHNGNVTTDAVGEFTIFNLQVDDYDLLITKSNYVSLSLDVNVPSVMQVTIPAEQSVIQPFGWPPPDAPANLSATPGNNVVYLTWDESTDDDGVAGYNVYRDLANDGTFDSMLNTAPVVNRQFADVTAENGTTYFYRVSAIDSEGWEGDKSDPPVSATPNKFKPDPPQNLVLSAIVDPATITVDWDDNSESDLDGYNVYRAEPTGVDPQPEDFAKLNTTLLPTSLYIDETVVYGSRYFYYIEALDTDENVSEPSDYIEAYFDNPPPPTGLAITDNDDGEIDLTLNWFPPEEGAVIAYDILRSDVTGAQDPENPLVANHDTLHYKDAAVTSGGVYYYKLVSINTLGLKSVPGPESVGYPGPPSEPVLTIVEDISVGETYGVRVQWNGNPENDIAQYLILRSDNADTGFTDRDSVGGTTTSFLDDLDMTPGVPVYYKVRAVDDGGHISGRSLVAGASPGAPGAPVGVSAEGIDDDVFISWMALPDPDLVGYNVYRRDEAGVFPSIPLNDPNPVTNLSFLDTTGVTNNDYYYAVTGVDNGDNESPLSDEVFARPGAPLPPTDLTAVDDNDASIDVQLSWTKSASTDVVTYRIKRSVTQGGPYATIANLGSAIDSYRDFSDIVQGTTYYYVVSAVDNDTNESIDSNEDWAVPGPPLRPTGLTAVGLDGSVELNWDANEEDDLGGYRVFWGNSQDEISFPLTDVGPEATSATHDGLTNGTTYWYTVYAYDTTPLDPQVSLASIEDSAVPNDSTPPAAPANVVLEDLSTPPTLYRFRLSWDAVADAEFYRVFRSTTPGGPYTSEERIGSPSSELYLDTSGELTNGTNFYYVVAAVNQFERQGDFSTEVGGNPGAPFVPENLMVADHPDVPEIELTWDAVPDADLSHYQVFRKGPADGSFILLADDVLGESYIDDAVTSGERYDYQVKAADSSGFTSDASDSGFAVIGYPAALTGVGVVDATGGVVGCTLSWNEGAEADLAGYNVYRAEVSGGPYGDAVYFVEVGNDEFMDDDSDDDLVRGTTYYYVLVAVDMSGNESPLSTELMVTPGPPALPTGLTVTQGATGVLIVSWDASTEPDLANYLMRYKRSTDSTWTFETIDESLTEFTLDSLNTGDTYYFQLGAEDDSENSSGWTTQVDQIVP